MEKQVKDILDNYDSCSKIPSCDYCEAWKAIEGTETTWCEFLRERDKRIFDRIDKVING